ncbi:magnesium-importing ATPase [Bordetella bronchiseptica MBORD681]|uniref:magnesium-translocating P-type ATPase n=1 Tax=Bordetella bronchiseptica TaxID=518 RepID=UPI0004610D2D|nr:magnesium-translocating P-type ATPase [Bordetella bronchiseptica]KDD04081.1 magnesium-importing ATPase [Bordetella bronchiseptica MBORD681]KDD07359.1 magnesium-importing ATPase [Bordetella bronchiseptica MBORD698]
MKIIDTLLKRLFSRFLQGRHANRHFKRQAILETLRGAHGAAARAGAGRVARDMRRIASDDVAAAMARMGSREGGLSAAEVHERRTRFGPNEVEHEKPLPGWLHLWHCYRNPFNLLLSVLAGISFATDDMTAAAVIGTMVALSTLIRFVQEGRSSRAAERLKAMVGNTATVIRRREDGEPAGPPGRAARAEVPIRDLVPGDHIVLSAGDMIPADCRLLAAKDLFIAQAAMTGESLPVEKFAGINEPFETIFDAPNLVFMGTTVVSGAATALVIATGGRTYFGGLSARVTAADRAPTAFESGVNSVSWLLIRFALVMAPVVLLINGFTKGDWLEASLFALSVAVGLTPEMLPMIVTSTLAKGAVVMSRKKVIVKRLDAIQNFGAMDVLCTDKTGTLTQDRIALERHTDAFGNSSDEVLRYAYLNSYYQTGLKNLLDHAVLEHAELQREMRVALDYRKVDEIPFDFERRRMSVVVSERDDHHELICKGAVEEMLSVCDRIRIETAQGPRHVPLDGEQLDRVRAFTHALNEQGLRVVAVAMKALPASQSAYSVADEAGLTLVGHIAFLDPPKESTEPALRALAGHGVRVKVLTGDSELIAAHVCGRVGLEHGRYLLGAQIENMSDEHLACAVETHQLFARLTPQDKERIVRALRGNGHVVGFMGDGINDASALRAADIGISVDAGVDIAKEAADIILLEKSLMVLEEGVVEGRRTFCNMLKYIRMTASSNFGNVFSVLVGSAFLPFLPMLPLQLLVQNLLYDISQIAIPFDDVDEELVAKPLKWNPADIGRFMVFFGPLSSVFDIATYVLMWHVFAANTVGEQGLFQSGWFVVGLLTQTLIVHMIRSPKLPFIQSRAAWPLLLMTALIMAIGVALPMSPLAGYFNLQALPPAYFPWLLAILLGYALLTTAMKKIYIRKFGWQ